MELSALLIPKRKQCPTILKATELLCRSKGLGWRWKGPGASESPLSSKALGFPGEAKKMGTFPRRERAKFSTERSLWEFKILWKVPAGQRRLLGKRLGFRQAAKKVIKREARPTVCWDQLCSVPSPPSCLESPVPLMPPYGSKASCNKNPHRKVKFYN